jgi:hypothetical protein
MAVYTNQNLEVTSGNISDNLSYLATELVITW